MKWEFSTHYTLQRCRTIFLSGISPLSYNQFTLRSSAEYLLWYKSKLFFLQAVSSNSVIPWMSSLSFITFFCSKVIYPKCYKTQVYLTQRSCGWRRAPPLVDRVYNRKSAPGFSYAFVIVGEIDASGQYWKFLSYFSNLKSKFMYYIAL